MLSRSSPAILMGIYQWFTWECDGNMMRYKITSVERNCLMNIHELFYQVVHLSIHSVVRWLLMTGPNFFIYSTMLYHPATHNISTWSCTAINSPASVAVAMVFAVYIPPHAPGPGQALRTMSFRSSSLMVPAMYLPYAWPVIQPWFSHDVNGNFRILKWRYCTI